MEIRNSFAVMATVVSNEFIDRYMIDANGEYVKVYLYLLRHQAEKIEISLIADALNHTESDVRRALAYWEKLGVLHTDMDVPERGRDTRQQQNWEKKQRQSEPAHEDPQRRFEAAEQAEVKKSAVRQGAGSTRTGLSQDSLDRLTGDDDFAQLLYIAQKYVNRVFTQRDMAVFGYLYDELHMSAELLEYLVEHCVQGGHTSLRYIETVAINWHEKGFATVEEARAYAESFKKNTFAVMKAFGLTDRKPAEQEKTMIDRWFTTYGFTKELVLEACNRTISATHTPSFQYADKILSGWKQAGVRTMHDVTELDQNRQAKSRTAPRGQNRSAGQNRPANQFHNFEQRDTDYNQTALDDMKAWIGTDTGAKG